MTKKLLLTASLCLTMLSLNATPKIYRASKMGIKPSTGENVTVAVNAALAKIKAEQKDGQSAVLLFDKGRYDFTPQGAQIREYYISNHDQVNPKTVGIAIEDMKNLTIDGGGSDFYFNGRMLPISLVRSENCTIKNLSIDNPNPQITQIEIIANDTINGQITYEIAPWVSYKIEEGKLVSQGNGWEMTHSAGIAFEKGTKHIVFNTSDIGVATSKVEQVGERKLRAPWKNKKLIAGTVVTMRSWHRPTPGVFMDENKNTTLENVKVHYCEGMGLIAQMCENITLDRFSVCLRGADDPRYFTAQADATHFSGCKGEIISKNGLYENMMDDAINVHGTYLKVTKRISDNTLLANYMHSQSYGFLWGEVGDTVQFIDSRTMEIIDGQNIITSIAAQDKPTAHGAKEFLITFKNPIDTTINERGVFGIENLEWTPSVVFSGNTIRNNRARGSLFSTPRPTLVEDNLFDHTSGTAILLCGDCNGWFETGACRNVMIRKNRFINSLTNMFQFTNAIISIYPEIPDLKNQKKYFHGGTGGGVVIENNVFETFDNPILYGKSIDGLVFRNNTIRLNSDYPAFHWNKHRFLFERATNVTIENNDFQGGFDRERDIKNKEQ